MLHHAWRAVSGALRMRRSRECRRQGHVKASPGVPSGATTDLVALGWLTCPDRVDKDALACATWAYRAGNRDVFDTLDGVGGRLLHTRSRHRGFAHRLKLLRQLPSLETVAEGGGPQQLSLGGGPSEVLGAAESSTTNPRGLGLSTGLILLHRPPPHPSPTRPPSRLSRSRSTRWSSGVRGWIRTNAGGYGPQNGGRGRTKMGAWRRIACCDGLAAFPRACGR